MRLLCVSAIALLCACGGGESDDAGPGGGSTGPGGTIGGGGGGGAGGGGGTGSHTLPERVRYPTTQSLSPITSSLADNLDAIVANDRSRNADMFMKIGDSISESYANMSCFASSVTTDVQLDGRTDLQNTITFFRNANTQGPSPCTETWCSGAINAYNRDSYAAAGGETASFPLEGTNPALDREDDAINPQIAFVQYGTNDSAAITAEDDIGAFVTFYADMAALTDTLIDRGIVPILLTIPPKATSIATYRNVPTINALVRVLAQSRGLPLADLYRELFALADYGLFPDGIHPNVVGNPPTTVAGCDFTAAGLAGGHNRRNLLQIQSLDRLHEVLEGEDAPDSSTGSLLGTGTEASPYIIDTLPFVDSNVDAATTTSFYRLSVEAEQWFRVIVVDPDDGDAVSYTLDTATRSGIAQGELDVGDYLIEVRSDTYAIAVIGLAEDDPTVF